MSSLETTASVLFEDIYQQHIAIYRELTLYEIHPSDAHLIQRIVVL